MIIREYKSEDREGIEECILVLQNLEYRLEPHYWAKPELVVKKYFDYLVKKTDENGKMYVAEVDGTIAGLAAVRIEQKTSPCVKNKKFVYVSDLAVLEKFQTQGIGDQLLKKSEEYARTQGFDYIYLDVTATNISAVKFYYARDYNSHEISMEKKL